MNVSVPLGRSRFVGHLLALSFLLLPNALHAQQKGEPGKFDFYLLNVVPAAEFCNIKDAGPACKTPRQPWVLHGLWAQNDNGTYPVFCADAPGPRKPRRNLDLTPDLTLLDHEWKKHGTCTTLAPEAFFAAERNAFHHLRLPPLFLQPEPPPPMKPSAILAEFARANPSAPLESLILWCSQGKLTSVSECLSKDLRPIACRGLKSCADDQPIRQRTSE